MKYLILMILLSLILLQSCQKEELKLSGKAFKVENIESRQMEYLEPALLKAVHSNLIQNGRLDEAKQLLEQYDSVTGILRGADVEVAGYSYLKIQVDSSQIPVLTDTALNQQCNLKTANFWEPNAVIAAAHVQSLGDMAGDYQSDSPTDGNIVGTTG